MRLKGYRPHPEPLSAPMICPKCQHPNPDNTRSCEECGAALSGDHYHIENITGQAVAIGPYAHAEYHEHKHFSTPPIGYICQAPPIPNHFVPRPDVSDPLLELLLSPPSDAPGKLVISAVHGLGGIGKTTLAAALTYDERLRQRFPDGILWVTLGQQPDVLSLQSGWIQTLGDYQFHPLSIDTAANHLRTLLGNRACLLVIDDAWKVEHVQPFLAGGSAAGMLITTRDATLARSVSARLYDLDVMNEAQALALFESRLGKLGGARETAAALAQELGYLPLALELAAAQVEDGYTWKKLLAMMRQGLADLDRLSLDEAEYRNGSLRISFRLSLEPLSLEEQEAFTWFGVLPEDTHLNPRMASTLWGCDEELAEKCLRRFRNKALLKDVEEEQYTVHDLLHDEARLRLVQRMTLPAAHAALLDRYATQRQERGWHTLPEDGYIHAHLVWHMEQAGQVEAIHALLREETKDSKNGWFTACERLGLAAIFLGDARHAWKLANEAQDFGLGCRYALVVASMNSLAGKVPAELIAQLVKTGMWTFAQGLAYARQRPEAGQRFDALVKLIDDAPNQQEILAEAFEVARQLPETRGFGTRSPRAEAISALAPFLSGDLLSQALQAAWEIENGAHRTEALSALAPLLSGDLQQAALSQALNATGQNKDEVARADLLSALAPLLSDDLLFQALDTTWKIKDGVHRARTLGALAPFLPDDLLSQALNAAWSIWDEDVRARALSALAPFLPDDPLSETLDAARQIVGTSARAHALTTIAPLLSGDLQQTVLLEALESARQIWDADTRTHALVTIIPLLPDNLQPVVVSDALNAAGQIDDKSDHAYALITLAPFLPNDLQRRALSQALESARLIWDESTRAHALSTLAQLLPDDQQHVILSQALNVVEKIESEYTRASTLSAIAPLLSNELLSQALDILWLIENEYARADALSAIAPLLSSELLFQTFETAKQIGDENENEYARASTLGAIAPLLSGSLLSQALDAARQIGDGDDRARALCTLVPLLTSDLRQITLPQVMSAARQIRREDIRVDALCNLAPLFTDDPKQDALKHAIEAATQIEWESDRAKALVAIALTLRSLQLTTDDMLSQVLNAAWKIKDGDHRARVLTALAPLLSGNLLSQALDAIWKIEWKPDRARALIAFAPFLENDLQSTVLTQALDAIEQTWDEDTRARALSTLAPLLPGDLLFQALEAAQKIRDELARAGALIALAPCLPDALLFQALNTASRIENEYARARTLSALAPFLTGDLQQTTLTQALDAARQMKLESDRARVLIAIAPLLPDDLRQDTFIQALDAARQIDDEYSRAGALAALIPSLPGDLLTETLETARQITDASTRARALSELALSHTELPSTFLAPLWQEILSALASHTRQYMLGNIKLLPDLLHALGGEPAITETFHAIQDVGRWWP